MEKTWLELNMNVPAAGVDLVCNELAELGCDGVTVEERELDTFVVPDPDGDLPESFRIKAYFPQPESGQDLNDLISKRLLELAPLVPGLLPLQIDSHPVRNEDWAEGWKQHFQAVRIGQRLIVKPTWEDFHPTGDDVVVNIDPGMAFGTGTHGTTRLCLEVLAELYQTPPLPERVLDVGTGSGILAIAAAALGAKQVWACDIEEEAIRTATANAQLNAIDDRLIITPDALESLPDGFDVVVANILAEENIRLGRELNQRLKPGGTLILSGILQEKEALVVSAFSAFDLNGPVIRQEGEWVCLCYQKGG
ncbi:MAG: 50S ribosomal protein L11 methyltransferase [Desulfuromonadaceae bacterium]